MPGIDCVLFADPRKSTVDIVQAVGRALRPSEGKKLGYVILPVLHETDATSEQVINSGVFKEILSTISALAANDDRIIEYFRGISQGRKPSGSSRVSFEWNERIAEHINIADFISTIELKCWHRLAKLSWRSYDEAEAFVHGLGLKRTHQWDTYTKRGIPGLTPLPPDIPTAPRTVYANKGWVSYGRWLGTERIATFRRVYRPFNEARDFAHSLKLNTWNDWRNYCVGKIKGMPPLPEDIPAKPMRTYANEGWIGLGDWLGTDRTATNLRTYLSFKKARDYVRKIGLKTHSDWVNYCKGKIPDQVKPADIPNAPWQVYETTGWVNIGDWLGTGKVATHLRKYREYKMARMYVNRLKVDSVNQWRLVAKGKVSGIKLPEDIPSAPQFVYKGKGWVNWGDWLGNGAIAWKNRNAMSFQKARAFARGLNLKKCGQWELYCKGRLPGLPRLPISIPTTVERYYRDKGWVSMRDFLGIGNRSKS